MLAWNFGFWMWRLAQATDVLLLGPAEYSAVMCGSFPGTWATWQWLRLSMICCCAPRPWSWTGVISELLVPLFGRPVLSCWDGTPWALVMAAYVRDGCGEFHQPKFECGCCEMLLCGARQNFYVFSLYRNHDQDDRIYDCLQTAMAAVQEVDARALFLLVGDLNGYHVNVALIPRGPPSSSGSNYRPFSLTHIRAWFLSIRCLFVLGV